MMLEMNKSMNGEMNEQIQKQYIKPTRESF